MKKKFIVGFIIIIFPVFSYGILVGHYEIFPFEILSQTKFFLTNTTPEIAEYRSQIYQNPNDVVNLIRINSEEDIIKKRQELIDYIWIEKGFPFSLPNSVENNVQDVRFDNLYNLKRIDSLTMVMEPYEMNSITYLFLAENSNNKLVIYNQGHEGADFIQDKDKIQFFLENGYSVLIFSMVGSGMNNEPIVELPEFGKLRLNSHDHFKLIESSTLHPIKYFFEPIAVSLNYIDFQFDFDSYYMIGLSGGGWITAVYPAIDPRIKQSYSFAGSFPIWLRSDPKNFGDYEQNLPDFYKIANYEELYVMGAFGENRKLILIYNQFDPCCFSGELYNEFPFGDAIKSKLTQLGSGHFDVFIDNSHKKHIMSDLYLSKIIKTMNE